MGGCYQGQQSTETRDAVTPVHYWTERRFGKAYCRCCGQVIDIADRPAVGIYMDAVTIDLTPSEGGDDDYSKHDKNLIRVRVQLLTGEMVCSPDYRVEVCLSRDGMIGLATELLRAAHNPAGGFLFRRLRPSDPSLASEVLGVFMHPRSCELIVMEADLGTLENALGEQCGVEPKSEI
jgi:hypothetical protein